MNKSIVLLISVYIYSHFFVVFHEWMPLYFLTLKWFVKQNFHIYFTQAKNIWKTWLKIQLLRRFEIYSLKVWFKVTFLTSYFYSIYSFFYSKKYSDIFLLSKKDCFSSKDWTRSTYVISMAYFFQKIKDKICAFFTAKLLELKPRFEF